VTPVVLIKLSLTVSKLVVNFRSKRLGGLYPFYDAQLTPHDHHELLCEHGIRGYEHA